MLGKCIWDIARKEDSLWLKWVNHLYMKGRDWKRAPCRPSATWTWKQLWLVKEKFKDGYQRSEWKANAQGYTVKSGYEWLRPAYPDVEWKDWVWNRLNIPRHSFICWMISWKRIKVRAKLKEYGYIADARCPLCLSSDETVDHLFFECCYTQHCSKEVLQRFPLPLFPKDLQHCNQMLKQISGRFKRQVYYAFYAGLLYSIWQERNNVVWNGTVTRPEVVMKKMIQDVYYRITTRIPKKLSNTSKLWLKSVMS